MSSQRRKRALVLDGGGLRGAFTEGVLTAFYEAGIDYRFFDYYISSSAGACNMAYFLTGQIDEGLRVWREHLHPKLFGWRFGKPYIDLGHLVHVFREVESLNVRLLRQRRVPAYAVLSEVATGRAHYENISEAPDPVAVLEAAVAIPFLAKPIMLNGRLYYDGGHG